MAVSTKAMAAAFIALLAWPQGAVAQMKVIISGGFSGAYEKLLPEFERDSSGRSAPCRWSVVRNPGATAAATSGSIRARFGWATSPGWSANRAVSSGRTSRP